MSQLAVNPDTGEAVQWDGTAWQPAQIAHNPQTGETRALVGDKWQFLTGTTKDGASTNDPATWERWTKEDGRSTGEQVARGVGLFGKGVNDAIGTAAAAPLEAVNWLMKQPGRAVEAMTGANVPNVLPEGGFYADKARGALNAFGRNDTPETTVEKAAYGAGQGVGNAVSVMAPAGAVAGLARAGSTTANVAGQLAAQPVAQVAAGAVGGAVGEATDNPWLGAAASLAVPAGIGVARAIASPGGTRISPEMRRLVGVAENEGIPLTAGQITGSSPMRTMESVFGKLPSTARRQEAINDAQRVAFNRSVMARAGETQAERATPDVIQGFLDRAGQTIQTVAARNTLNVDRAAMQRVQGIADDATRFLTRDQGGPVRNRIQDFISKITVNPNGMTASVEGEAFARLDSALSRQIRNTTDGNARHALSQLQEAMRDAMNVSMSGQDAALWAEARRHYANGKIIEKAMNAQNAQSVAGNIPPASLSQAVASGSGNRFARGRGDLNDLARVGRAFIQDATPDSGTAQRLAMQGLISGGVLGGGSMMSPGMIGGALAGIAVPKAAQMAYYSPMIQRYLTQQIGAQSLPQVTPGLLGAVGAANTRPLLER